MSKHLRVALFSDSFHERNGVGTVSREFVAYAQRHGLPFCSVRCGPEMAVVHTGPLTSIELRRGIKIKVDKDIYIDPALLRYRNQVMKELRRFEPDLIHITGPSDVGVLGFWISNLMGVPLVASWHTNLHEYLARRIHKNLRYLPEGLRNWATAGVEHHSMTALMGFYRLAHFVLAPNEAMVRTLADRTGRPSFHMMHGVDGGRFAGSPRDKSNDPFCIGWVGRLTPEKNVRAFVELERGLLAAGVAGYRMLMVGDGSEVGWLRSHLRHAEFTGFLEGSELVNAYAAIDVFVFPSKTDTFGLVVLEAMAMGIAVVLSKEAGERVGIRNGIEGLCSGDLCADVRQLMESASLRKSMGQAAIEFAQARSWDRVFDDLYRTYELGLGDPQVRARLSKRAMELAAAAR